MKLNVPFVGIIGQTGFIESYDYKTGKTFDFHHDHIMSPKALTIFDYDSTLRFILQNNKHIISGAPSLSPFDRGSRQIKKFTSHVLSKGAHPSTLVKVEQQGLGTPYEGKKIGTLAELHARIR